MNKEEIESLFKKYKVRIPKEKQGQSECYECKRHQKYSLTWTSFLYEYEEKYYCFEHILIILLQQENQKYKEVIFKIKMIISARIKEYQKKIDNEIDMGIKGDHFKICRYEENIKFLKNILKEVK